jgi:hypothetical protein
MVPEDAGVRDHVVLHASAVQRHRISEGFEQHRKRTIHVEAIPAALAPHDPIGRFEPIERRGTLELDLDRLVRNALHECSVQRVKSAGARWLGLAKAQTIEKSPDV